MSISLKLRAQFAAAAKAAAERGEREAPVAPGSDTAIALGRLYGGFPAFLAERAQQADRAQRRAA